MGLFSYYPGSSGTTIEAGDQAVNQQATLSTLEGNLGSRTDAAVTEVTGDLPDDVGTVSVTPSGQAQDAGRASLLAGGSIRQFATAITTYNGHIDDLNAEYETLKQADFYASGQCTTEGIEEATDADIEAAGAAVRARLERDRQGYEDDLDGVADLVAGLLNGEPSDEALLTLYLLGSLDASALADKVDIPLAELNELRFTVATTRFALDLPLMMNALSRYTLKLGPGGLHRASTPQGVKDLIRTVMRQQGINPAQAKAYLRARDLLRASTPGNLFSKPGFKPGAAPAQMSRLGALGRVGTFFGRYVLPPASIAVGGYGLYDTYQNWDELPTDRKVSGVVGNTAFLVGGVGGTAMAASYAMSWSFPPLGAAITVGAGVVALGAVVYENWDAIENFATETVPEFVTETVPEFVTETAPQAISDGASWAYDKSGLDSVVDGVGDAWNSIF